MGRDIYRKIGSLRNKLHKSIEKTGLNSKETRELSDKIDELINRYEKSIKTIEYPQSSKMMGHYKKAYAELKKITENFGKFPSVSEWNYYAKENNLLSSASLEYISTLNWNNLRVKVLRELNMEI